MWLGKVSAAWIAAQPDRAQALKDLKAALVAADLATAAGRVDRYVALFWVAYLLGWDEAQELRVAAIRELSRLVARNSATEEYAIRRGLEAPTRALCGGTWSKNGFRRLLFAPKSPESARGTS